MRVVSSYRLLTLAICIAGANACSSTPGGDSTPVAADVLVGLAADILEDHYECDPYAHRPGELTALDPTCKENIRKTLRRELDANSRQRQRLAAAEFRLAFDQAMTEKGTDE